MPRHVLAPARIPVPGGKVIEEFVGRVQTGTEAVSVAHMITPPGWEEPHQTPMFDEVTIVVRGTIRVDHNGDYTDVRAGEAILCRAGERIRYHNPSGEEAEYWAVCVPAFSPATARREE